MAKTSREGCPPNCKYKQCTGKLVKPLPPEILTDAMQGNIHLDIGVGRAARSVKAIGKEGKE